VLDRFLMLNMRAKLELYVIKYELLTFLFKRIERIGAVWVLTILGLHISGSVGHTRRWGGLQDAIVEIFKLFLHRGIPVDFVLCIVCHVSTLFLRLTMLGQVGRKRRGMG